MRAVIILVTSLVSSISGQSYHRSSQDAAILSDARYLAGDGTFGAAYTQEDGVEFKEESDANGDRKGSYSYVDPTGHRRTVFYTAGKNGFQAIGDHIPTARPVVAPQPEYDPLPEYNPPDYRPPAQLQPRYQPQNRPQSHYSQESIHQPQTETRYNPSIPAGPRYSPPPPQQHFRPEPQPLRPRYRPLLSQTEPDYNPPSSHFQYHHHHPQYQPEVNPPRPQFRPLTILPRPRYNDVTTPAPRRINPPGKLDFNRTPDGFSYTFSKS